MHSCRLQKGPHCTCLPLKASPKASPRGVYDNNAQLRCACWFLRDEGEVVEMGSWGTDGRLHSLHPVRQLLLFSTVQMQSGLMEFFSKHREHLFFFVPCTPATIILLFLLLNLFSSPSPPNFSGPRFILSHSLVFGTFMTTTKERRINKMSPMDLPADVVAVVATHFDHAGLLAFRLLSRKANDRVFCARPELVGRLALKIDWETVAAAAAARQPRIPTFPQTLRLLRINGDSSTDALVGVIGAVIAAPLKSIDVQQGRLPTDLSALHCFLPSLCADLERLRVCEVPMEGLLPRFTAQMPAATTTPYVFGKLTAIILTDAEMGDADVEALVQMTSRMCPALTHLDLKSNNIGPAGGAMVANAIHFSSLTFLDLGYNLSLESGIRSIAHSSVLANLTYLGVGLCGAEEPDIVALANASFRSILAYLDLCHCGIGAVAAAALRNAFPNLVHLDLSLNMLGWEGAKAFAESEYNSKLTYLDICSNSLGDEGVRFVAESPHFRSLRNLDISFNKISKRGSGVFARSCTSNFPRLTLLDLSGNGFDLAAFANSERPFLHLKELHLHECQLAEAEVVSMATSSAFPALECLSLWGNNQANKEWLRRLFASNPGFSRLTNLMIY